MDSTVSPMDNPLTLPIRRGQPIGLETSELGVPNADSGEIAVAEAPAATEAGPDVDISICPRCGGKLVNPQELGWCPKCSYCRSLEADKAATKLATEAAPKKSTVAQFGEFGELVAKMPAWGWLGVAVSVAIVGFAMALNRVLPQEDSLARALISLLTIVIGIVAILCINLWSLFKLAATDENMGPKDIFMPFKLWGRICAKLPETRVQFLMLVWCLIAVVSIGAIVNGLEYWWDHYKPKQAAHTELLTAVNALTEGAKPNDRSLTESVEDFGKKGDVKGKIDAMKKKLKVAAPRQTTQCVILGYTLNAENQIDTLVVAALLNDRIRYAGNVRKGIGPKETADLLPLLTPLIQPKSYISGLTVSATWVKPSVFCEVTHEDFDNNQHFVAPQFKGLLTDYR